MATPLDEQFKKVIAAAFKMPSVQTMVSRKSSITNAFVGAIIPVVVPSTNEIAEALEILHLDVRKVLCAYCGDPSTEWDHLRPLVLNRRPTGFISEIANLVPACGKCNQSKGNKAWRAWMLSKAKLSPTGRMRSDVKERVARIEVFEEWRKPTLIDFESILGTSEWEHYWSLCDAVNDELRECQQVANKIRSRIEDTIRR